MENKIILLYGAPGSGKGTQSKIISNELFIPHISSGDLLRELNQGEVNSGTLVDDSFMIELISERINKKDCVRGFVLDGFPRTINQAEQLVKILESKSLKVTNFIFLELAETILIERMLQRKRSDDNLDVINERLSIFKKDHQKILDHYKSTLIVLDAKQTKEQIANLIKEKL